MRKFFKLCVNENIKLMKKTSTKVLIILAIVSLLVAAGFTRLTKYMSESNNSSDSKVYQQIANSQIESIQSQLQAAKQSNNVEMIADLEARLEMNQYAMDHNINLFYYQERDWKVELVEKIIVEKTTLNKMEKIPTVESKNSITVQRDLVNQLLTILNTNDFDGNIEYNIASLTLQLDHKEITQEEYQDKLEIQNLNKKYEINKINNPDNNWKTGLVSEIETINDSIRTGMDQRNNKILTYEKLEEQKDAKMINLYRLEHNMAPTTTQNGVGNYRNFYNSMAEMISMMFVGILVIITAGSAISAEISKGSIKFLAMTPNKRWKILLAKVTNLVVVLLVLTLILAALNFVVGNVFFSQYQAQPYLYASNGQVQSLGYGITEVLRFLTYDIDILVYMLLAMMLSVVTRNTALAVSLSIAFYFGSSVLMTILNQFVTADWIKFIPFNNMNLTDKIFSNATSFTMVQNSSSMLNNVPIIFSVAVLGVCGILMLITMFDSFNKRDIT